ncbi:hypothetical protein PR202_ga26447 [Eleusine coracana subsp. coracana]|uniref:Hydroxyproline-rich glycoprotein family protein n=1 Tax=Eleusine coracana subsp. coracana TaxID=191504 RepID=A0AAV5DE44_ELECO|nr:hypothetical protein PR202_ga26447 [Eleusine coracana subsp. coracana]
MASAAVIPSAAGAVAAAAGEPAGWLMDERDGFISWLRGEFAASNAIIDLLLVHLRTFGDPGEYDIVAAAVQQRRHHWTPVIHMQQFFPVADVAFALQQAGWRRRAAPPQALGAAASPSPPPPPPPRRQAFSPSHHSNHRHGGHHRADHARGGGAVAAAGSEKDGGEKNTSVQTVSGGSAKVIPCSPVEHSANEIIDGKTVNSVEGLKVYEGLVSIIEANKIVSLINETKASFRRGGLEAGQTVIIGKRPMKGHGREIVQLGIPVIDGPPDDENQTETRVEAIPGVLHDLFDHLFQQEIIPFKPDFCVVDFFNEGDYSHPLYSPPWSLLLVQGRSADFAKRAIPATRKQRILLHFGKSVARKNIPSEVASRFTPPLTPPPMPWGSSSKPGNVSRHPASPKPFGYAPASSVLPAPVVGPHHVPPTDGMQPLFVAPAPVAPAAIPFPPAVPLPNTTAAWMSEATPRPAPSRFPGPGTGVFLPPGANHHPLPHQMTHAHAEPLSPQGSTAYPHSKGTSTEMANGNLSPKSSPAKKSITTEKPECNGTSNGGGSFVNAKPGVGKEQQNGGMKNAGNSKVQPNASK